MLKSSDIIRLTSQYLTPAQLQPFLQLCKTSTHILYDASMRQYKMTLVTANVLFQNITIKGIHLCQLKSIPNYHKLQYLVLTNFKHSHLDISHLAHQCTLTKLAILNSPLLIILTIPTTLSHLNILKCKSLKTINNLQETKLHTLYLNILPKLQITPFNPCNLQIIQTFYFPQLLEIVMGAPKLNSFTLISHFPKQYHIFDLNFISNHTKLRTLRINDTNITDVSVLKPTLTKLSLAFNKQIINFDPIKNLVLLQQLNLSYTNIQSTNNLEKLIHLKSLHLTGSKLNNINNLQNLTQLKCLFINRSKITTINIPSSMPLRFLNISSSKVSSIDPLQFCPTLKTLWAAHCPFNNIEALRDHPTLRYLTISNTPVQDLSPLGSKLRLLRFTHSPLTNLDGLQRCINLRKLNVSYSLNLCDVSGCRNCKLIELNISNCCVEKIEIRSTLTSLDVSKQQITFDASSIPSSVTNLKMTETIIRDFKDLKNLTALQTLDLSNCNVENLDMLVECKKLTHIKCRECSSLQRVDALGTLNQLQTIDLSNCVSLRNVGDLVKIKMLRTLELNWCLLNLNFENCMAKIITMMGCTEYQMRGLINCKKLQMVDLRQGHVDPVVCAILKERGVLVFKSA